MKEPIMYFFIIIIVLGLGFGGWKLERYVHYKLSYSRMVEAQVDAALTPLKNDIKSLQLQTEDLQHQILVLQTNK